MAESAIGILVFVAVVVLICGLIAYLIRSAPFIEEPFKSFGVWAILAVAIIVIVIKLLELI
jgi:hypothetical protein